MTAAVPVCEEDEGRAQPGPEVLSRHVVQAGLQGELPHTGQGHSHRGVQVSAWNKIEFWERFHLIRLRKSLD